MDNKKIPATPETRKSLYENMGKTIVECSPILKDHILIEERLCKTTDKNAMEIFEAFLSSNIYVLYMNIELACVFRANFRTDSFPEKHYNIKWINCIILEGYKHLYGYKSRRKKSLWLSKIKPYIEKIEKQDFKQDFAYLENQIIEFGESNITDKNQRDLSFHYNMEPLLVYEMLMSLSEEEESQRIIRFMDLLQHLSSFVSKYLKEFVTVINTDSETSKYAFTFSDFDIFQNNKDKLYNATGDAIQYFSKMLDSFIHQQKIPEFFQKQFKDIDKDSINPIQKVIEVQKVAIQLTYLYIDLASATRAFISSEYPMERQLSMKYLTVIIFEGYDKIYGLNNESQDSFWKMFICPIISESNNNELVNEFKSIEKELQSTKIKIMSFNKQRQLSVHLDEGILQVYSMLHNLNPIEEFPKALELLNLLPKIMIFLTKCINTISLNSQFNYEKRMASTYKSIDNIIELLKKSPDTAQKEDVIRILQKFKSGDLFNEIFKNEQNE